ncbi:uncharacterized protein LOC143212302 isoform X2 [Lasioglossum baleicum]|uniref:uncharacterized protein LOC143212302 isoform X2 n=1 Tax=Lasioglossum baleicum TaxID=434251 RepID=UPI003FCE9924
MCENFVINAQAIRENTCNIGKKLQLATETILGTFDATERDFQHRSLVVPANRTNKSCKTFTRETTMTKGTTNGLFVEAECIDSSDSDVDNNYYNYVEEWELPSVKSPKSAPLLASIEFCDTATTISDAATTSDGDRAIPCAVVDIDIIEENNNDPNNNLEQENRMTMVPDRMRRAAEVECESIVELPGCSKDFVEKESRYYDKKLWEEVLKIHDLIPQFARKQIFAALRKNRCAENRVLLTLWDLLPSKRPTMASHQFSRHEKTIGKCKSVCSKYSTNHHHADTTFENNKAVLIEKKKRDNAAIVTRDIAVSPVQDEDEDIILSNDDSLKSFKNTGAKPKKKSTESDTVPRRIQNGILQPAKLIFKLKNTFEPSSTNNYKQLNKYMEYLEYMKNVKNKKNNVDHRNINFPVRNIIRQFFLHSKFKHSNANVSQFIKKNNKSRAANIADTNSNNDKSAKDEKEVCAPFKCDNEDSQYSKNDDTSANESSENLDSSFENDAVTVAACKNSNDVSSRGTSNQLPMDTVDAPPSDRRTDNIETPIPSNRVPTAESSATLSTEQCPNRYKTSIYTANNNPSNSNVPNDNGNGSTPIRQASGGEKRKESIRENNKHVLPANVEPIYNKLLSIFQNIDQDYIKNLCFQYYEEHDDDGTDQMTEDLIDYMLENNEKCPVSIKKDHKRVCKENMNQQVANLFSIFPGADEEYLRKRVQHMNGDQNAITDFIQTQCNNPTYITKEEASRRMKITKLQKQYFQNFNAEMFLELFPDPFQHFENVNRRCNYNDEALNFLKLSFNGLQESTLKEHYKIHKYNLSLTAEALDKLSVRNRPAPVELHNIHDILLLQECAFILHKVQIRNCMNRIEDEEKKEYEALKKDEFFECENCFEVECLPSKCFTCNDGHIFCQTCIKTAVKVEMGKGKAHVKCFLLDCDEEFSSSTLQKALPPTQFSILLGKRQETEVMAAGLDGLVSCPFCPFASIPPPEDKVFKCMNTDCMKESCSAKK